MLTPDARVMSTQFVIDKIEQWARLNPHAHGLLLSMMRSGEWQSRFVVSVDFGNGQTEGVVVGQLASVVIERTGSKSNPVRRDMDNDRKPPEARYIDLDDDQVKAVLAAWRAGRSAASVDGVRFVYRNGRIVTV